MVTWNGNSWTHNNEYVRKSILLHINPDFIMLTETKLMGNNGIELDGYTWFGYNRADIRCPAGIGIFVRNIILDEFI